MAEWSNAAVLKTVVLRKWDRGFESLFLRDSNEIPPDYVGTGFCFFAKESQAMLEASCKKTKDRRPRSIGDCKGFHCYRRDLPNGILQSSLLPNMKQKTAGPDLSGTVRDFIAIAGISPNGILQSSLLPNMKQKTAGPDLSGTVRDFIAIAGISQTGSCNHPSCIIQKAYYFN
jgi:hypothetical protein